MNELWSALFRILRDPRISATLILGLWVASGLALICAAYWGTADRALVVFQLPYVVSGGLGGIALVGLGLALLSVHVDRVASIEERQRLADVHRRTMRLARALAERQRL